MRFVNAKHSIRSIKKNLFLGQTFNLSESTTSLSKSETFKGDFKIQASSNFDSKLSSIYKNM